MASLKGLVPVLLKKGQRVPEKGLAAAVWTAAEAGVNLVEEATTTLESAGKFRAAGRLWEESEPLRLLLRDHRKELQGKEL